MGELMSTIGPRCTIREFKEILARYPDDYEISCCGQEEFFLHVDAENETIILDTEEDIGLEDGEDDEGDLGTDDDDGDGPYINPDPTV